MTRISTLLSFTVLATVPAALAAQQPAPAGTDQSLMIHASTLQWSPLELPGFAPGLTLAVVQGDPAKEAPYTLRLKFPDGYVFPAHFHPNPENVTILSGKFMLGHGATPDDGALKDYSAGDYLYIPGKMPHFGRVTGETVVQLHGMGPFAVMLAQPADKPK
jgi:quercetin dioxygenase-like cupin family protein